MRPVRRAVVVCLVVALAGVVLPSPSRNASAESTVLVEVVVDAGRDAGAAPPEDVTETIDGAGASLVGAGTGSVLLVEVPTSDVGELRARGLTVRSPEQMTVRPLQALGYGPTTAESATVMGATGWQSAGFDGAGVRVGVIDYFNMAFWRVDEMGQVPSAANGRAMCRSFAQDCTASYTGGSADESEKHGPAVVEVLRDVAPAADVFIASADTYSDYVQVIDWFAANGVTIINRSLGAFVDGPGDGRGPTNELVEYAASKGIVWINAAGNNGNGGYWRGPATVLTFLPASKYVAFDGVNDTYMDIHGCTVAGLRWANDWDLPTNQRSDYDLEVWSVGLGSPQFHGSWSSQEDQTAGALPIEQVTYSCPPSGRTLALRVKYIGGGSASNDTLEIIDYATGLERHQAAYSAALPGSDSADPSVLSVGAIDPPHGTQLAPYSSQGPTNDNRVKPDLVGPSGVTSSVYGTFSGTSASSPAVAGIAALLLQAGLATPGPALAAVLRQATVPLGSPVPNNQFGVGVVRLPAVPGTAPAGQPAAYHPLGEPTRIVDTRPGSGIGPAGITGYHPPGTLLDVPVEALLGRPAGSLSAVAINLTVVDAPTPGFVQALPTLRAAVGAFSNLNIDAPHQTRPNLALVPVGVNGSIQVYVGSGGYVLIDVLGTFETAGVSAGAGRFLAVDPARVLDTRPASRRGQAGSGPDGRVRDGEAVCVELQPGDGVPVDGTVRALVVNVTATDVNRESYVQALPTGGALGASSTLNPAAGATVANGTIVPLGAACGTNPASISVFLGSGFADAAAHVLVDVTGYITAATAPAATTGLFVPVRPGRVFDSRGGASFSTDETRTIAIAGAGGPTPSVPVSATAVALNVTATGTTSWGYVTAWPAGTPRSATSTVNWSAAGQTVANGALIKQASGAVSLGSISPSSTAGAHHIVDVFGYFTP